MHHDSPLVLVLGAAVLAGLGGSLHCAVMCGPLAAAVGRGGGARSVLGWHLGRFASYVALGTVAGASLDGFDSGLGGVVRPVLPWVMALGLVMAAFDLGRRLTSLPFLRRMIFVVDRKSAGFSPTARASVMGAMTPLLPCGVLWGMLVAAAAAGSGVGGGLVMGAHVLGSTPALLGAHVSLRGGVRFAPWLRTTVLLAAALVLVARAVWLHQQANAGPPLCH